MECDSAGGACAARSRSEEEAMLDIVDDERRGDRGAAITSGIALRSREEH
jgi:hypothetical protein